ncbi:hypothetical protein BH09PSE5_BH09PSE5_00630 [soil metagenome]
MIRTIGYAAKHSINVRFRHVIDMASLKAADER